MPVLEFTAERVDLLITVTEDNVDLADHERFADTFAAAVLEYRDRVAAIRHKEAIG